MSPSRGSFLSLSPGGFHRIAYLDWGNPASDHVVVCVHGLARNSRDFDYLARELASDCRVVCVDVVGRGDSEWLADKSDYSFSTYLTDAAALIARISAPAAPAAFGAVRTFRSRRGAAPALKRIDWLGTSMGGLIGMLLAAKPGSPIRRLVLNDVGPFISWGSLYRLKGYVAGVSSFGSPAEVESHLREVLSQFGPLTDEQWRHLAEHSVYDAGEGRLRLRYDPGIGDTMRGGRADPEFPLGLNFLAGIDLWGTWAEIRCPTLVLRGAESDVLSHETLVQMQASRPGVEAVEFAGTGHAPALMSYDQIAAVKEFLLR
ncbi:MAG TPA: alpha/beta hydrolase [Burkholderiales bacterium]|jgi:pimeloyl-ACP methyl ester carboxylesterase